MDGTIVDTEPYWMVSEGTLVRSFGGEWTHEDALGVVGWGLGDAATRFQAAGVTLGVEEIVEWMTADVLRQVAVEVPWRPGARELLAELKSSGVPTALVTMSLHRMAEVIVDAIGFPAFDVIVGGDDVAQAKPHPAPYLHAAELLSVDIAECVAIEDSVPGVQSAFSSGATTIAVPLHSPIEERPGLTLWPTLDGRTVADLSALLPTRASGSADSDSGSATSDTTGSGSTRG